MIPGVWIISETDNTPCGFLYSVRLDDLEMYSVDDLLFALISATFEVPSVCLVPAAYIRTDNKDDAIYRELKWACLNVILLLQVDGGLERVAVGQIDQAAWDASLSEDREIVLV